MKSNIYNIINPTTTKQKHLKTLYILMLLKLNIYFVFKEYFERRKTFFFNFCNTIYSSLHLLLLSFLVIWRFLAFLDHIKIYIDIVEVFGFPKSLFKFTDNFLKEKYEKGNYSTKIVLFF